jgi:N-acetylmuramoyl-L-alanine amidase
MSKLVAPLLAMLMTVSPVHHHDVPRDTISQIAINDNVTFRNLHRLNPTVEMPKWIDPKDVIKVPPTTPTVVVKPKPIPKPAPKPPIVLPYSSADLNLLSRLVTAEAKGEPYEGKIAVAKVVMNRVASSKFPGTIRGVIYEHNQFSPVSNGMINRPPTADSISAAKEILSTYKGNPNGAMYYYNPNETNSHWIKSRHVLFRIGKQVFSR